RRRAVSYVSTGLACLPRDIDAFATTAEVRLYKHPQEPTLSKLEVPQKQSFRLRNRSRKLFRFGF
uniref:hypothetical protein n=1 Tax=Candidatus Limisoma sp. TaxID=3076476 RepID=UPI003FF0DC18